MAYKMLLEEKLSQASIAEQSLQVKQMRLTRGCDFFFYITVSQI